MVSSILFQMPADYDNKNNFIRTRAARRIFPGFGFLFLLLIHGAAFTGDRSQFLPREDSKAILSAVHSEKIRAIIRRLNSLAWDREYTELEIRKMRTEQIELLVQAAEELIASAENLPEITAQDRLSEEEQTTFRAMARQLHQTCNACHNLFRDQQ